ncbi:MAG: hypothetical protein JSU94_09080 [Phycisphaerales bacterium]|nr:MAG: hypothetical protein JSU94_09080 [Phycisphaerales bacterium]
MATGGSETLEDRVLETANRLRLIQVDFADQSEQTRRDYLSEQVEVALKGILPEERREFLERLASRFPTGSAGVHAGGDVVEGGSVGGPDVLRDTVLIVRSLVEVASELTQEQQELVLGAVGPSGGVPSGGADLSIEVLEAVRAKLKLRPEVSINGGRLSQVLVPLVEFVCKLDPLVWNMWRTLSPRSGVRRSGNLGQSMGQYSSGEAEVSLEQVEEALKHLQRLTAAVITAVGRVGGQFAKSHLAKYSPSEISALVKMERGSVLVSHEVKCWRKYQELADTLNEDSIDTEVRKAIVDYVESLVKGMGR